ARKRYVVPGRLNRLTFTAEVPGEYRGQCAEFCGASHANMGMRVIVDAPDAFAHWVAAQKADPAEPAAGPAADGKAIFARSACVGCIPFEASPGGCPAPNLTRSAGRRRLRPGLFRSPAAPVAA